MGLNPSIELINVDENLSAHLYQGQVEAIAWDRGTTRPDPSPSCEYQMPQARLA